MARLRSFWRGDMPLAEAFWTWALGVGLVVNIATTVLFLALISADRPWLALLAGYAVSVPYNLLAVLGVWRSAARYQGNPLHADLARGAVVILMAVLSVT